MTLSALALQTYIQTYIHTYSVLPLASMQHLDMSSFSLNYAKTSAGYFTLITRMLPERTMSHLHNHSRV